MKLLAFLLVTASLIMGLIGAASAYFVPLRLSDDDVIGLTAADNVAQPGAPAGTPPIIRRGATVDAATLTALRDAGASHLRVEEFSFGRWSGGLIFGLACVGLAVGGLIGRQAARRSALGAAGRGGASGAAKPESHLDAADAALLALQKRWPGLAGREARCRETLLALGPTIEEHLPAFAATRPQIVARLGLGGFASVMDRFAAAERQIHRAWSAAADGVPEESEVCLERARVHLAQTRERLGGTAGTERG
jgi:hypothetical protein